MVFPRHRVDGVPAAGVGVVVAGTEVQMAGGEGQVAGCSVKAETINKIQRDI